MVAMAVAEGAVLLWLWRRDELSLTTVLLIAVGARLLFFTLPPVLSDDVFRYLWDGRLSAQGANPFLTTPAEWGGGALFSLLNSEDFYSVYPPLSQIYFWLGAQLAGGDWMTQYYVTKAFFVGLEAAGVLLLARVIDRRWLLLYALHPVVLLEAAGQGHTEAAMVFFLIVVVWSMRQERPHLASAALACAAWIKLYPILLFPFLWQKFGRRGLAAALGVTAAVWLPFWSPEVIANMRESLDLYVRLFEFNAGPYYALKGIFHLFTGQDWSKWLGPALRIVFLAALPVIYYVSWTRRWTFATASYVTLGAFFLLATTVHPWYLLGILVLLALREKPGWHWQWAAHAGIGTYLFYMGVPFVPLVAVVWGGWLFVLIANMNASSQEWLPSALFAIMRRRGQRKARWIDQHLPSGKPQRILDLGAGEGFVGEALSEDRLNADVELVDIVDFHKSDLPFRLYDGRTLPYEDDAFDGVVISFVLHHSADPERVLSESRRVCRGRVIVIESVYRNDLQRRFLRAADRFANRLRSSGAICEEALMFRGDQEWRRQFERIGFTVSAVQRRGRLLHPQVLYVLDV